MKIVENEARYLPEFVRLNEEWISRYFVIEEPDRALAADPMKVIRDGGYILSLVDGDDVIGVLALFNEGNGVYQLAKMAVAPAHQGRGYGRLLMEASLAKLRALKASKVYLDSNTVLDAAITLYRKHGFRTVPQGEQRAYSRANIRMERDIP